jgi:transcriptional regulator with PAS, ATPase and Fis domain
VFLKKSSEEADRELMYRALFELKKDILELKDLIMERHREVYSAQQQNHTSEVVSLDDAQREAIINALEYSKGNKRMAAEMLNISERTLYRKIRDYKL